MGNLRFGSMNNLESRLGRENPTSSLRAATEIARPGAFPSSPQGGGEEILVLPPEGMGELGT